MSAYALPGMFPSQESLFCFQPAKTSFYQDLSAFSKEEKIEFEPVTSASVRVIDARVDPVRLIQALTENMCKASSKRKLSRSNNIRRRHSDPLPISSHAPQEAAMEFVLSVSLSGCQHTCVRSLAWIRQLRQNLVREFTESDNGYGCSYAVKIPELPRLQDECSGLGFSLLHDVLRCYTPILETWFQTVLSEIAAPELSPSLSDFFYEPRTNPISEDVLPPRHRKSCPVKLDSIEESDDGDSDEEEEATE